MRKLVTILLLAVAAQCQTTDTSRIASDPTPQLPRSAILAELPFSSSRLSGADLLALTSEPLSASLPRALPPPSTGQPMIKTAVLKPVKVSTVNEEHARNSRVWYSLVAADHIAAGFDAYSTRQAVGHGAQELNPFLKPFADSAAIYPALQVWPTAMDFVGNRMMRSQNRFVRKVWWVPQAASTVTFVTFGFHNLSVAKQ